MKAIGARLPRYDGVGHVTGQTVYVDDIRLPHGNLWAKALRSPHHSARILRLDTSKAERMAGVRGVITHADVPNNVIGHLEFLGVPRDEPLLAVDDVRYLGQPVAAVAADSEEAAQAAVDAIDVEYEEREPLFDMRKAFDKGAPQAHHWGNWYPHFEGEMDRRQIRRGSIDEHAPGACPERQPRPRIGGKELCKRLIEPKPGVRSWHRDTLYDRR